MRGFPPSALIHEFYADVPLRRPLELIDGLVDISEITAALGWVPKYRASIEFAD